jgi:hypothetical protein
MKPGKARFKLQIAKIEKLIAVANSQENPALWLFLHDLRTPVFMLEGLAKLYADLHDKKAFLKLKEQFKTIEDALGAVDYYASFQKEFVLDKKIPATINRYFQQKTNEKLKAFNQLLIKGNWLDGKKLKSVTKKLDNLEWKEEVTEIKLFGQYYKKQILKINEFVKIIGFPFENIEDQVHELRRKLRWLSIYPQALNGAIKLKDVKPNPTQLTKYLTPEIVNSPFNILPISAKQTVFLNLDKNKFLALSWMIAELGKLKDSGLKISALKNAFQATSLIKDDAAFAETYKILGKNYPQMSEILEKASEISKIYFEENNLNDKLLVV